MSVGTLRRSYLELAKTRMSPTKLTAGLGHMRRKWDILKGAALNGLQRESRIKDRVVE
jgi:hypothetical protein